MFKWIYIEKVETNATAAQVWAVWADAINWPVWDSEIEWVDFPGDFVEGAIGTMKPKGGPLVKFTLTRIEPLHAFHDVAKLPLTRIEFIHRFSTDVSGKSYITHEVRMRGFLVPLFSRVIGSKIRAHLKIAIQQLSSIAEKRCHTIENTHAETS